MHVLQAMFTMLSTVCHGHRVQAELRKSHARALPFPFSAAVTHNLPKLLFGQRRAFVAHGGPKPGLARSDDFIIVVQQQKRYLLFHTAGSYGTDDLALTVWNPSQ